MKNISNYNQEPNEYFKRVEEQILNNVERIAKSLLETFKFSFVYSKNVSEKQEKITEKAVKSYRNKFWKKALEQADGNKNKAYMIYTKNLKLLK